LIILCFVCSQFQSLYSDVDHGSGDDGFPFQINQHTGVVTTRRQLDRENDGSYFRFDVTTGDFSADQFIVSDWATVEVHVTDRNDNSPTIVFPVCDDADHRDCELDVMTPAAGDVITRVIAVDADDVSEHLRYELIADAAADRLFGINSTSGEVYARREIATDLVVDDGRIQLQVRVTDAGVPPLTTTVVFVVRLNVTRPQQLGVNDGPTSTNLALPVVLVAAAAVIMMVTCFLAARRIGPLDRSSETTYVSAPAAYVSETSVDDVICGADCSTDVALGSTLRLQVDARILHQSSVLEFCGCVLSFIFIFSLSLTDILAYLIFLCFVSPFTALCVHYLAVPCKYFIHCFSAPYSKFYCLRFIVTSMLVLGQLSMQPILCCPGHIIRPPER